MKECMDVYIQVYAEGNNLCQHYSDAVKILGKEIAVSIVESEADNRQWTMVKQEVEATLSRGAFPVASASRRKKAVNIFGKQGTPEISF